MLQKREEIIIQAVFGWAKGDRIHYLKRGLVLDKNMNCLSIVTGEETKNLDTDVDRLTYVVVRAYENSLLIAFIFFNEIRTRMSSQSEGARTILSHLQ